MISMLTDYAVQHGVARPGTRKVAARAVGVHDMAGCGRLYVPVVRGRNRGPAPLSGTAAS